MNETLEKQKQYTRSEGAYFNAGTTYADHRYVAQRAAYSAPDRGYPVQNGYAPDYNARNGYNAGYNVGYDPYYAPESGYGEAYRASYDNRYNYEARSAAPVYSEAQDYDLGGYSMQKEGKSKKKMRLNTKAKILIALYFAIIAVVATLILVNVVIGGSAAEATAEPSAYTQDAAVYYLDENGNKVALDVQTDARYTYDTSTNAFDEFCDWLGRQVG